MWGVRLGCIKMGWKERLRIFVAMEKKEEGACESSEKKQGGACKSSHENEQWQREALTMR